MAEKREMTIENIKKASEILKDGKIDALVKSATLAESQAKNLKTSLETKLKALEAARKEKELAEKEADAAPAIKVAEKEEVKP